MKHLLFVVIAASAIAVANDAHAQNQTQKVRADSSITAPKMLGRPNIDKQMPPEFEPGATLIAYKLAWQAPDTAVVADRLAGALAVMEGAALQELSAKRERLSAVIDGKQAGSWTSIASSPILAKYEAEYDEIRLINQELDIIDDSDKLIDEDEALKMAESYLQKLGDNKVIDSRLYRQAVVQLGYKMAGSGSMEAEPQPGHIVEYRVTYRPTLNGIELANAGVRLGILGSGELASMRVGGVTPSGQWEGNTLQSSVKNSERTLRTSPKNIMSSFYNQLPKDVRAQVAWSKVMYAVPQPMNSEDIEPMLLISYSEVRNIDDQPVVSRRKTLGYSLTTKDAEPVDFDKPATKHSGMKVSRDAR